MLKIYISSVVIWMVIIYCAIKIFGSKIKENGWLGENNTNIVKRITSLFILSAIPILRLLVFAVLIYMSTYTKEQYEKLNNKEDND